jgi:predicted outer membrane repeat protein
VAVTGNTSGVGAGVYGVGGRLNIIDSTVSGNQASTNGGGVLLISGATANITNSTVSGNQASSFGGGVYAENIATIDIETSTIANNTSTQTGGRIFANGAVGTAVVNVKNSIVSSNTTDNCSAVGGGAITSLGNNLDSADSCGFAQSTDQKSTDPLLVPLQDYNGQTDTHALLAGSPAIDAGDDTACPATDQRGEPRPEDGDGSAACDVGPSRRRQLLPPARPRR